MHKGENKIKIAKGAKVNVIFQELHLTFGIHMFVYYLEFYDFHT